MLQERDRRLLADVFLHRAMTRPQIESLYFSSLTRCNTRLRALFDHGYLRRDFPDRAAYGSPAIYTVGPGAARAVAAELGWDPDEVRRHCRRGTPEFLEHTLAVVDYRLALESEIRKRSDLRMDLWLPELLCRHDYEVRAAGCSRWVREVLRPDAFQRLLSGDRPCRDSFVEIDRGNQSARRIREKLQSYRRYSESGAFTRRYGGNRLEVLLVTTGERRLQALRSLARQDGASFLLLSTYREVRLHGPVAAVWRTVDDDAVSLSA